MTSVAAAFDRAPTASTPWFDNTLRWLLVGVLLAAPLPLGCAGPAERAWLTAALGGVGILAAGAGLLRGRNLPLPPATLPLTAFAALVLFQLAPMPTAAVPAILGDVMPAHGSLVPVRTWTRFGELLALFACYAATARLLGAPRQVRAFAGALVTAGAGLTIYGLLAWQGGAPLADDSQQTRTVMVATFVNRNHLANVLAMAALVGLGLFAALRRHRTGHGLLVLVASGIVTSVFGIVGTQSRGGIAALGAGALAFTLLAVRSHRAVRAIAVVGVAALLTIGFSLLPTGFASRFSAVGTELQTSGSRPDIWAAGAALWRAFPWLGTGLGTYGDLSPATQPAAVPGRVEHAHCDPLELLVETGLVGSLLLLAAALAFAVPMLRRCLAETERERALLAAGGLAALTATAVHACVEFTLQIPANAAWTAAIAGAVVAVLRPRRNPMASPRQGMALLAVAVAAAGMGLVRADNHQVVDGLDAIARGQALLAQDPASAAGCAQEALSCNEFSPRAHRLAGQALLGTDPAAARGAFARALRWTNPADRPAHELEVARLCLAGGNPVEAQHWLARQLPAREGPALFAALAALCDTLPIAEAVLPLLPTEPARVRATFAEVLVRRGDFAGRELVLAQLRGAAEPALLTVADDVRLTTATAGVTVSTDETAVQIELAFARSDAAARPPLVLRCEGNGAAIYRSFHADADRFAYTARFDSAFPPGTYTLSLDFRADAPHFPFATVELPTSNLDLRTGTPVAATRLYWTTAEPGRRIHPPHGLPLRPGDVVWRDALLPEGPCDLLLRTQLPTRLRARFAGSELAPELREATTIHRFALPAATAGLLEIDAVGDDSPLLLEVSAAMRRHR
jgi:O-antigen ligase